MVAFRVGLLAAMTVANLLVALLVLLRNTNKFNSRAFFLLLFSIGGWAACIAGFLSVNSASSAIIWAKAFYVFPIFIGLALAFFVQSFPSGDSRHFPAILRWLLVLFAAVVFLLVILPGNFLTEGVVHHDWGKEIELGMSAYIVYSAYIVVVFAASLWVIYKKIRFLSGLYSEQARLFFMSFLIASFFGVVFNLVLPAFGNYRLIWLGPLFTSVLVLGVGISIVKHRMFDVRLAVARSLAYSFSILILLGVYALVFYFAIDKISDQLPGGWKVAANLILILVAVASYGPLKRFFDRITNRLFYRDAYDPQVFLDQLNRALVADLDLEKLLGDASSVIASNLKAEWCVFGVRETDFRQIRVIGTSDKHFKMEEISQVRKMTPHLGTRVIVTDNLPKEQEKLKRLLAKNDIALLARLAPNNHRAEEGLGYIVLGPKLSGNPYSAADERIIDLISQELLIATQNALHFEEIQNFNTTLQGRVGDATRKLRHANERLHQLDETKDDFISMASHQLRTPLTSVKGYLSLILDGDVGRISAQQRKMLQQAYISSQRMVYLIADLLNVSRLKTGKFAIEEAPVNLAEVVSSEMDQLVETAKSKGLTLTYDKPGDSPDLMLDETKTRQVIMNFVDNAIYYTPEGGKIEVKLEQTPHAIEFRVVDNGMGVPASERHHLFTKFYRAKNAQKARPDGTGLGLFMAKKVIVGEGGSIIFDSEENKGSTFGFSFPRSKLAKPVQKPTQTESVKVSVK